MEYLRRKDEESACFLLRFMPLIIGRERPEKETKIPTPSRIHKELLERVGETLYSFSLLR